MSWFKLIGFVFLVLIDNLWSCIYLVYELRWYCGFLNLFLYCFIVGIFIFINKGEWYD